MSGNTIVGPHLQYGTPDWPNILKSYGWSNMLIKIVGDINRARDDIKRISTGNVVWYRHHYPSQPAPAIGATVEQLLPVARAEFLKFVDGTFLEHAKHVDMVQGYNEFFAESQKGDPADRQRWVNWAIAEIKTWKSLQQEFPQLAHIGFVSSETAPGNDIDWQVAQEAVKYDDVYIGYHPYWPMGYDVPITDSSFDSTLSMGDGKRICPGSWRWITGRWEHMEEDWVTVHGMDRNKIRWAFGEMGPIGVNDGKRFESGMAANVGWRDPKVCNANRIVLANSMRWFENNTANSRAYKEGRLLGGVMFTTGGGTQWKWFETTPNDWQTVQGQYTPLRTLPYNPTPTTPPPSDGTRGLPYPPITDGAPRTQYKREYWWVDFENEDPDLLMDIMVAAAENVVTIGPSMDDAGLGKLDYKKVVVWNYTADRQYLIDWFNAWYHGTELEFRDIAVDEYFDDPIFDEDWPTVGPIAEGVDINIWQGDAIDWTALQNATTSDFVYIRCLGFTKGSPYLDPDFLKNWTSSSSSMFSTAGPYFLYGDSATGVTEILNLAASTLDAMVPAYDPLIHLPPAIDVEVGDEYWPLSAANIERLFYGLTDLFGVPPIIYTSMRFWSHNGGQQYTWDRTPVLPGSKLWLAEYTNNTSRPPVYLPRKQDNTLQWSDWTLWQWTTDVLDGRDYGVASIGLDLNIMRTAGYEHLFML